MDVCLNGGESKEVRKDGRRGEGGEDASREGQTKG